jgi:tRNA(fMet)-specific endonuclease VapC
LCGLPQPTFSERHPAIGPNDLLIAALGLAHNLILVTHNAREFSRVEGLKIEDWEIESI